MELPFCLNCGAEIPETHLSSRRTFALCAFCGTVHNVSEFFATRGRAACAAITPEQLAAARKTLAATPWYMARGPITAVGVLLVLAYVPGMLFGSLWYGTQPGVRLWQVLVFIAVYVLVGVALVYVVAMVVIALEPPRRRRGRRARADS